MIFELKSNSILKNRTEIIKYKKNLKIEKKKGKAREDMLKIVKPFSSWISSSKIPEV